MLGDNEIRQIVGRNTCKLGSANAFNVFTAIKEALNRAAERLGHHCEACGAQFTLLSGPSIGCAVHGIRRAAENR